MVQFQFNTNLKKNNSNRKPASRNVMRGINPLDLPGVQKGWGNLSCIYFAEANCAVGCFLDAAHKAIGNGAGNPRIPIDE